MSVTDSNVSNATTVLWVTTWHPGPRWVRALDTALMWACALHWASACLLAAQHLVGRSLARLARLDRHPRGSPMTRLLALSALAGLVVVAWLRRAPLSSPESGSQAPAPEDDVQPADPWLLLTGAAPRWVRVPSALEPVDTAGNGFGTFSSSDGTIPPYVSESIHSIGIDPTYLEAQALAAIRRSTQSSDASTGGM